MTGRLRTIAACLVALTVSACGVPLDDTPRPIAAPTSTTSPQEQTNTDEDGGTTAFLFFIANERLINLEEDVSRRSTADVLSTLFRVDPTDSNDEVTSQIPTGTRLLSADQSGETLVVNVSEEFDNLVGPARFQATAQIVLTATELSGVDVVTLRIEGEPTQVFSPSRGDVDEVGACDYVGLLPTIDLIGSWSLDQRSQRHLTTRRNMLVAQCPSGTGS
ncbi:MAG TPA: GerMN domain-containing protein [Microthrixaceae bacterium]|nr:GerMN domain-containing protein [Microthrixaceae bacterium]HNI34812.1 GerMN domain-containing protein [Microthrixaceae bacterium]